MSDSRVNVILGARDEASKTVTGLRGQFERFKADAKAGFGLGAGISAFNLLQRGIGAATDAVGDAVAAAAEEEAAIAQLSRAIAENDQAWDGNMARTEERIRANYRLAVSDGEQREALQLLVGQTKDADEAFRLLATAIDFARFRNIDLRTSADLLGRAYAGNFGTLSRYGVVLEKGATATQAIAQIQKMAAGQAEAYADTTQGKLVRSQVAAEDAMEDLGAAITPVVGALAEAAAETIPDLVEAVLDFGGAVDDVLTGIDALVKGQVRSSTETALLARQYGISEEALLDQVNAMREAERHAERLARRQQMLETSIPVDHIGEAGRQYMALAEEMDAAEEEAGGLTDAQRELAAAAEFVAMKERIAQYQTDALGESMGDAAEDIDEARLALRQFNKDIEDFSDVRRVDRVNKAIDRQKKAIREAAREGNYAAWARHKARLQELRDERDTSAEARRAFRQSQRQHEANQREIEETARKFGVTREKARQMWLEAGRDVPIEIDTSQANAELDALRQRLRDIQAGRVTFDRSGGGTGGTGGSGRGNRKGHSGVLAHAGETVVVRHDEALLTPAAPMRVVPMQQAQAAAPVRQTIHVPVYLDGRVIADVVDERLGERASFFGQSGNYRSAA